MVPLGTNDVASPFFDPSGVPPSNELVNPPVRSLRCSDLDTEPEQSDVNGSEFYSHNENCDIHLVIPQAARLFTDNVLDDEIESSTVDSNIVRPEHVAVLRLIFAKYGNIAKNCALQTPDAISHFPEMVCSIILKLQQSNFKELTSVAVAGMLGEIQDLENVKFNMGWLCNKLEDIKDLKKLDIEYSDLKDEEVKIERQKKLLESCEADLVALQAEVLLFQQEVKEMTEKHEKGIQKFAERKHMIEDACEKDLLDGLL